MGSILMSADSEGRRNGAAGRSRAGSSLRVTAKIKTPVTLCEAAKPSMNPVVRSLNAVDRRLDFYIRNLIHL
jgi:hypothetical protein